MPNLATNKNEISNGLAVKPVHITDCIDALTGAKTFDDVKTPAQVLATPLNPMSAPISTTYKALPFNPLRGRAVVANSTNTKAYGVRPVDLGQESVALDLAGTKVVETPKAVGFLPNAITLNFSFRHKVPTVATARVIANLLLKTDLSLIRPFLTLTNNSLAITGWATIADGTTTGVTLATRTLVVGKTYNYALCYGGNTGSGLGTVRLYENGILIHSNTITYNSEYIASLLAGVALRPQLEANWMTNRIFNYSQVLDDVSYYWNNGRPDLAIVRDYDKWGSNTELVTNGTFDSDTTGWIAGNANISSVSGGVSGNCLRLETTGSYGNTRTSFPTRIGSMYKISFYAKREGSLSSEFKIGSTSGGGEVLSAFPAILESWSLFEYTFIAISTTTYLRFGDGSTNIGRIFYLDNVSSYAIGSVADYSPSSISDPVTTGSDTATITAGNTYEVTVALTSDDEVNPAHANYIGANDKSVGARFVAVKSATLNTDGRVKLVAVTSWLDNSTNALNATVSGNPLLVKTQVEEKQGDGIKSTLYLSAQFTASGAGPHDTAVDVPAGWMIDEIGIDRTAGTGSRSLAIKALTSSGTTIATCTHADDYSSTVELQNLNNFVFTKKRMSKTANVRLFLTGSQAGDSWILNIRLKVAQ